MKCIIIDDEPLAAQLVQDYAGKVPGLEICGVFNDPVKGMMYLVKSQADLVFLDIQMPVITGIEMLKTMPRKPMVIITTAYAQYALEGYELDVVDYLLKPFTFQRFIQAISKAQDRMPVAEKNVVLIQHEANEKNDRPEKDFLFVKHGYKSVRVNFQDILFIEGLKEYVTIYTRDKKLVKQETMKNLEELLTGNEFIRVHKSYIVSVNKIEAFYGNVIEILGHEIPIGRNYRDKVMERLNR